ncbi:hypothetical protein GCM10028819_32460 [Spirosoma humi]
MEKIMEKIKDRIGEKSSPIKSLKSLAEAIGMSEGGFYMMFKKGTMKIKTKEAICKALDVSQTYFDDDDSYLNEPNESFGDDVLSRITKEMHEMRQVFEEELKAKNLQIAGLQRMLESVLGKSEGAISEPLSAGLSGFNALLNSYRAAAGLEELFNPKPTNKSGSKVGGTPFSQAENALNLI